MPKSLEEIRIKTDIAYAHVRTIHVDVMNGTMTHAVCWPFNEGSIVEFGQLTSGEKALPHWKEVNFEVDIMMKDPEDSIAEWVNAGFKRIIVHIEAAKQFGSIINEWKNVVEIGAAINTETDTGELHRIIVDGVDFVQFMCIQEIGFQGTPFDDSVLDKISAFHKAYPEMTISADGGIKGENIRDLARVGVTRFVMGSAVYNMGGAAGVGKAIDTYKMVADTALALS